MFLNSVSLIFFLLSFMQRSLEGAHVDKPITSNTTNTMTGFHVSGTAFTCKLELSHLSSNVINFIFHTWRKENLNFCRKPRGIYIFAANRKKAIRIYSVRATRWPNIAGGLRMHIHYCDLLKEGCWNSLHLNLMCMSVGWWRRWVGWRVRKTEEFQDEKQEAQGYGGDFYGWSQLGRRQSRFEESRTTGENKSSAFILLFHSRCCERVQGLSWPHLANFFFSKTQERKMFVPYLIVLFRFGIILHIVDRASGVFSLVDWHNNHIVCSVLCFFFLFSFRGCVGGGGVVKRNDYIHTCPRQLANWQGHSLGRSSMHV